MRFRDDRRAAALQVGAVLLLGILVIGLALYQATVVPDQNERVEFTHSQQVQESLQDVRNGILRTAAAERTSPTTVPLGTRYPPRLVAVNPPPSSGRLATDSGGEMTLVNATAINDETADYWNGTNRSYATQRLSYTPDYSVYQSAPRTVYDDTVTYNEFDGESRALTDQRLLEGNLIYVVALNGSLGRSGTDAVSVSPTPVSASSRTVAVNGSDIAIEVATDLSEDEWERLLADQYERNGGRIDGNASGVRVSDGTLTVDLVSNRTYRLRMAKVGVGTGVTDTSESYLTVVDGADSVTAGGTRRVVLEVRDAYNNPVSGVTVNASVNRSDASISPTRAVSDGEGRVVYEYGAPTSVDDTRVDGVNFTFAGSATRANFSGEEPESVRLNVTVVPPGGGSDGSGGAEPRLEYPDVFHDGDGNPNEDFEDATIPPSDPEGFLSNFENMQAADGETATVVSSWFDNDLDVGTATRDVPAAEEYTLEINYTGRGNKVDVVIVDDENRELQRVRLDNENSLTETTITLDSSASEYVRNNGTLYVRYEKRGGGQDFVLIEINYQRLRLN